MLTVCLVRWESDFGQAHRDHLEERQIDHGVHSDRLGSELVQDDANNSPDIAHLRNGPLSRQSQPWWKKGMMMGKPGRGGNRTR